MSGESWGREVFERLYGADPDPWRFDSSPYEAAKSADSLRSLGGGRFRSVLELGCSIGAMTDLLAPRCDALQAVDISATALGLARARCRHHAHVAFHEAVLPGGFGTLPQGPFDLVVISELLYFLSPSDIDLLAAAVVRTLASDALLLLVNWTGHTDTPCTGDVAAERFLRAAGSDDGFDVVLHRRDNYRLDLLLRRARRAEHSG